MFFLICATKQNLPDKNKDAKSFISGEISFK